MKKRQWTILTNHAAVFIHLLEHNEATIRSIADHMGYTLRDFLIRVLAAMEKLTPEGLDAGPSPTPKKTLPSVLEIQ
jgi:hypothetical protein